MTRFWNEAVAFVVDDIGLGIGLFVLLVLLLSALVGLAWHFFPRWVPDFSWTRHPRKARTRGRRRFQRPRWRRRKRERVEVIVTATATAADSLPDVSGDLLRARADAFAAEGRFAEAVRERLRAMVRELVDASVIPQHPDWTVTELARAAAEVEVALDPALSGAATIFSDIWYGQRPAAEHSDRQMRAHDAEIRAIVVGGSVATR